jgi:hypothetical protein
LKVNPQPELSRHPATPSLPQPRSSACVALTIDTSAPDDVIHRLYGCISGPAWIEPQANRSRSRRVTFLVHISSADVDSFMHDVMNQLVEAEFGRIVIDGNRGNTR